MGFLFPRILGKGKKRKDKTWLVKLLANLIILILKILPFVEPESPVEPDEPQDAEAAVVAANGIELRELERLSD